ncbi:MAG: hypothetical protein ACYDB2_06490 [Acidimicrobiales bacterium]
MRRVPLNYPQRVVIVVGAGIVLYFFGVWAMTWGPHGFTGWTGYAPVRNTPSATLTATSDFLGAGLHPWVRLIIWLILAATWVGFSLVLLRSRSTDEATKVLEH